MLEQKISLGGFDDKKIECGILMIALGHPYYGRMAYNLAMSIKAIEPFTHITLVYTDDAISHINKRNMWVFDNKMQITDTSEPFGAKLLLNQLSPYDRTIYLDVDTLWVYKAGPSKVFEELNGIPFTGITEGFHDYNDPKKSDPSKKYFFWADVDEIEKEFPIDKWANPDKARLYQWRSEFIYFEKSEQINELFELMRSIYGKAHSFNTVKKFADHIPDELAINIACAMLNYEPHKYRWQPTYWDALNGGNMPHIDQLRTSHYLISCGSNASYGALKRVYDNVSGKSAYKLNLQHVFPLISKKEMIKNRQLM